MSSWNPRAPPARPGATQQAYVTVELTGGFANRVFQILAAKHVAEKSRRKFVLVQEFIRENAHQPLAETMEELRILFKELPLYIGPSVSWNVVQEEVYAYYTYSSEFIHRFPGKNIVLKGYFQNENYFPLEKLSIDAKQRVNTYFLHLRFGDYAGSVHDVGLGLYYRKAIQNIVATNQLGTFLIFSDEPDKVDEYIQNEIQVPIRYSVSHAGTPLAVLKEMAECTGAVCANSSLSWLGAYLQRKPRGKIFMPDVWMTNLPKRQMVGFYPAWANVVPIRDVVLGSRQN